MSMTVILKNSTNKIFLNSRYTLSFNTLLLCAGKDKYGLVLFSG